MERLSTRGKEEKRLTKVLKVFLILLSFVIDQADPDETKKILDKLIDSL